MYEQGNGTAGMAPRIPASSDLPHSYAPGAPVPPTLSEAFAALANLRNRLETVIADLSLLAGELHGEPPGSNAVSFPKEPARTGLVGGFVDVTGACHSLVADLEQQAVRIHVALGL